MYLASGRRLSYTPSIKRVVSWTIHKLQPVSSTNFRYFLITSSHMRKDTRLSRLFHTASDGKLGGAWGKLPGTSAFLLFWVQCAHAQLNPFYYLFYPDVTHVRKDTRPSPTLPYWKRRKAGRSLGTRLGNWHNFKWLVRTVFPWLLPVGTINFRPYYTWIHAHDIDCGHVHAQEMHMTDFMVRCKY